MAREAMLVIDCKRYSEKIIDIINLFYKIGWEYSNKNNHIEYLPLGDDDFNWQKDVLLKYDLKKLINDKQYASEITGIILYHNKSETGITFLTKDTKKIVLCLDINRRTMNNSETIRESLTDVSWYISNIIQKLVENNCPIDYFQFTEYTG